MLVQRTLSHPVSLPAERNLLDEKKKSNALCCTASSVSTPQHPSGNAVRRVPSVVHHPIVECTIRGSCITDLVQLRFETFSQERKFLMSCAVSQFSNRFSTRIVSRPVYVIVLYTSSFLSLFPPREDEGRESTTISITSGSATVL